MTEAEAESAYTARGLAHRSIADRERKLRIENIAGCTKSGASQPSGKAVTDASQKMRAVIRDHVSADWVLLSGL